MLKLKGKMFTAKELIDNIHDLEKLNSKAYFGIFFFYEYQLKYNI